MVARWLFYLYDSSSGVVMASRTEVQYSILDNLLSQNLNMQLIAYSCP